MPSPYLEQPLLPITIVLPRLLEMIETALGNEKLQPAELSRLRQRAELIRGLLEPKP